MTRKKPNPADSLERFIHGVYVYYRDRGMPEKNAKLRMLTSTLEACLSLIKDEEQVPDQMLVIQAQFMAKALNNRGAAMTKLLNELQDKAVVQDTSLQPLRDIKALKDATDNFIETYKGWSEQ